MGIQGGGGHLSGDSHARRFASLFHKRSFYHNILLFESLVQSISCFNCNSSCIEILSKCIFSGMFTTNRKYSYVSHTSLFRNLRTNNAISSKQWIRIHYAMNVHTNVTPEIMSLKNKCFKYLFGITRTLTLEFELTNMTGRRVFEKLSLHYFNVRNTDPCMHLQLMHGR